MTSINVNNSQNQMYELMLQQQAGGDYTYNIQGPDGESYENLSAAEANAKLQELGLPGLFSGDQFILSTASGQTVYDLDPYNNNNPLPDPGPVVGADSGYFNNFSKSISMNDAALMMAAMTAMRERNEKLELAGMATKSTAKGMVAEAHKAEMSIFKDKLAKEREKNRSQAIVGIVAGSVACVAAVGGGIAAAVGASAQTAQAISSTGTALSQITTSTADLVINGEDGKQAKIDDLAVAEKEASFAKQIYEGFVQTAEQDIEHYKKNKEEVSKMISDWFEMQEQMTRSTFNT